MGKKDKVPSVGVVIPSGRRKTPRAPITEVDSNHCSPSWRFSALDLDGPWGWRNITAEQIQALREKLRSFETMKWVELEQQRSTHSMPTYKIVREAQNRLQEIELDEVEELYQLQLSNKGRIWGIRHRQIFDLLWWDPEHTVYPTEKKRT